MDKRTVRDVAAAVAAGVGVLLLADLSLGWYAVKVAVAGVINIDVNASGWGHFGTVAGLLTIAMLIYMIRPIVTTARSASRRRSWSPCSVSARSASRSHVR